MTMCRGVSRRNERGYTFLEIGLALSVVAILLAVVIPLASPSQQERRLRHAMAEIASLVRASRSDAESSGQAVRLVCEASAVRRVEGDTTVQTVDLDRATLSVRFQNGDWQRGHAQEWQITSFGIVRPARVRLEDKRAWLEAEFDPLTGDAHNESYSF